MQSVSPGTNSISTSFTAQRPRNVELTGTLLDSGHPVTEPVTIRVIGHAIVDGVFSEAWGTRSLQRIREHPPADVNLLDGQGGYWATAPVPAGVDVLEVRFSRGFDTVATFLDVRDEPHGTVANVDLGTAQVELRGSLRVDGPPTTCSALAAARIVPLTVVGYTSDPDVPEPPLGTALIDELVGISGLGLGGSGPSTWAIPVHVPEGITHLTVHHDLDGRPSTTHTIDEMVIVDHLTTVCP